MKKTVNNKKNIYLFNIIMGAICVLFLGVSMLTNEMPLLKVLFVIALLSYIVFLICFFRDKKMEYK